MYDPFLKCEMCYCDRKTNLDNCCNRNIWIHAKCRPTVFCLFVTIEYLTICLIDVQSD